jgi:NADH:ubiquinone oxidoreductase subunit 3 (subunit A)
MFAHIAYCVILFLQKAMIVDTLSINNAIGNGEPQTESLLTYESIGLPREQSAKRVPKRQFGWNRPLRLHRAPKLHRNVGFLLLREMRV